MAAGGNLLSVKGRRVIALIAAGAAGLGWSSGHPGSSQIPKSQRTHPDVRPSSGTPATVFRLSFRLRQKPGHRGYLETTYQVQVSPRQSAVRSCPPMSASVESGRRGQLVEVPLKPPAGGWCQGSYRVTVYLVRGPYCPPPPSGRSEPCPEFATQEMETGRTRFSVHEPAAT